MPPTSHSRAFVILSAKAPFVYLLSFSRSPYVPLFVTCIFNNTDTWRLAPIDTWKLGLCLFYLPYERARYPN
jgi:hypothetical protein